MAIKTLTQQDRNFEISLLNSYVNRNGPGVEYLQIYLRIERSIATKIFVVVVAVMNCECLNIWPLTFRFH